jgi:hypothetical protein
MKPVLTIAAVALLALLASNTHGRVEPRVSASQVDPSQMTTTQDMPTERTTDFTLVFAEAE